MFKSNDYIVYGRTGVCLVEGTELINGQDYYCLRSLHQDCRIKAPVNGRVPIRKVITKAQANTLIDTIPAIEIGPLNIKNPRELNEKYKALISSQDCRDLLELTMAVYAKKRELQKSKKKLNSTDEAYWKEGEGLLFGELAIALGIPFEEVPGYIRNRLSKKANVASEK